MSSVLPKYYQTKLDNGLKVVAIPLDNNSGVINVDVFYNVGSKDEVMGKSGIAHMLEHMNFKSTKNLKAGEFDEIVKSFGGVNNASTSFDYTHYFIKTSTKNLDKSLELFAELMCNLELKNDEFQSEREVVAEERRWRTDNNPMGYLYFRLFNNAFIYHPYHWTPIGFMNDILNWNIKDIKAFHKTYYAPNNALVLVAGDIDKDRVFESVKKYFSHIKPSKNIPKNYMIEPPSDGEKEVTIYKTTQNEMVAIAFHIPDFKNKDQVALSVISELLSGGKSSRLYINLINKKQLVNSIYAYNMEQTYPSLFIFLAVCNNGVSARDVKKEILKEIDKIKLGKISKKELDKIKINTKSDFIFSLENSSNVANLYGSYLIRGDIKPLLEYEKNLKQIDIKTIKNVANKYFNKENSITLYLLPKLKANNQ